MAKKQTRRSISVSRTTYERLKAFCEANNISMSQLVETRVNDFLGNEGPSAGDSPRPRPMPSPSPTMVPRTPSSSPGIKSDTTSRPDTRPVELRPLPPQPVPMTSVAARYAVEPPPPIIKPRQQEAAPKPVEKKPEQIFTF